VDRPPPTSRYKFGEFELSPRARILKREGRVVPLIPRYFDLLLLLVERRHEAVHRRAIFDRVWSEVVVSEGALTQAVRTLRRSLGDDPRDPVFIRTVSRHGYQFVYPGVLEAEDTAESKVAARDDRAPTPSPSEARDEALLILLGDGNLDERREAAEKLHELGTAEALAALEGRSVHPVARALLRDTRWDVPLAGAVPLLGAPGATRAMVALVRLRLGRALGVAASRWQGAAVGGAAAGFGAGFFGGTVLRLAPGAHLPNTVPVALAIVGAAIGGVGAAGVGAGLAMAEVLARSRRQASLILLGALGGGIVGAAAHLLGRWTLEGLFGHDLSAVGGGLEGLVMGAGAGLGYAATTRFTEGGMAAPRGLHRVRVALGTAIACALSGLLLTYLGRPLGGVSIDIMARSFPGSQVGLAPVAHLFGERDLGPITRTILSVLEGGLFGLGLGTGLTRRPASE
jgi:DNA-binding winged helix-turn-helix (wHTH) protein